MRKIADRFVSANSDSWQLAPGEPRVAVNRRLPVRRDLLLSLAIGALGFTSVVLVSWPGFMSPDSVVQLQQARSLAFTDDHPPLMALLWALPDALVSGPIGMLLLLNALYWGALVACFHRFPLPAPLRVVCLALTGFLPPLYVNLGVIWKDILMQGALVALLASCLAFEQTRRTRAFGWALFWSAIAIGSRHNASAAVWPLLALTVAAHPRLASFSRLRRATTAIVTSLVLTVCIHQALVIGFRPFARQTHFWQTTALFDLAGMSLVENEVLFDRDVGSLREGATVTDIERQFDPSDHWSAYRCRKKGCRPLLALVDDPEKLTLLSRNWLSAVSEHPLAYLRHRAIVYRHVIGLEAQPVITFPIIVRNPWGYALQPSRIRDVAVRFIDSLLHTPLFSPWVYLLICCAALALGAAAVARGGAAVARGSAVLALALGASGVMYHATFFFLAGSHDYRYSLWTMMCAVLATYALPGALGAMRPLSAEPAEAQSA
jgi:hypothetical protein